MTFREIFSSADPHFRSLRFSLFDAFFFALMVGFGETYILAFANASEVSEVLIGFLGSAPLLMGAALQLVSPWGVSKVKSYKSWVLLTAWLQALSFAPLIVMGWFEIQSFIWILICATLYWGAGFASGPAWNSWMTHLVPNKKSAAFFSQRLKLVQVGILLGVVFGGLTLELGRFSAHAMPIFAALFSVAMFSRLISIYYLQQKKYAGEWHNHKSEVSLLKGFWSVYSNPKQKNMFVFLFLFYVVVCISGPFVTPYLLSELKLSYFHYMLAIGAFLIGKIAFLPLAHRLMETSGVRTSFLLGAIGTAPLPALWMLSDSLLMIIGLQLLSGAFWSCFEVSLVVIFFDRIKKEEKTSVLALYNLFNSIAIAAGSIVGGHLLHHWGEGIEAYYRIFSLSAIGRTLAIIPLFSVPVVITRKIPSLFRQFGLREGQSLSFRSFLYEESHSARVNSSDEPKTTADLHPKISA